MGIKRFLHAFTLVELSVVLVVIAIITGMTMNAGLGVVESSKQGATEKRMDEIEKALMAFRTKYGRLPCPADPMVNAETSSGIVNFGLEAPPGGGCIRTSTGTTWAYLTTTVRTSVPSGMVPVTTLKLPQEFAYDGWGRKFQYEMAPELGTPNSFKYSPPSDVCTDKGPIVNNESATTVSDGAAYVLSSMGANGAGAYTKSGTRINAATVGTDLGTDEQTNLRSISAYAWGGTAPQYVMKNGASGTLGTAGYYDDIVRYKNRAQLMTEDDRKKSWYLGPDLVLGYDATSTAGGSNLALVKIRCGRFAAFSGSVSPALTAANTINFKYAGFTPNNTALLLYFNGACHLYRISGSTLTEAVGAVPNCPTDVTTGAIAASSGTLALSHGTAPYVRMWKWTGSKYVQIPEAIGAANTNLYNACSTQPTSMSFSDDGKYFTSASPETVANSCARLYTLAANGKYKPIVSPSNTQIIANNIISPNGVIYLAFRINGSILQTYNFKNLFNSVSASTSTTFLANGSSTVAYNITNPRAVAFSPDSEYYSAAGISSGATFPIGRISPETSSTSWARLLVPIGASGIPATKSPKQISFSRDGYYMVVATGETGATTLPFAMYQQSSGTAATSSTYNRFTIPLLLSNSDSPSSIAVFAR